MLNKPKLGQGNVDIEIAGEVYTLKPTVHAIKTLSRKYGGLNLLLQSLAKLDFEAVCDVIEVGLGRSGGNVKQRAELAEAVFETGLTDDTGRLAEYCIRYVVILIRGGRPMSAEEEAEYAAIAESGETPEGNPQSSSEG